jgi:hypothetical protein
MLLSALLPSSDYLVCWSPNGSYLSVANGARIVIRAAADMHVMANMVCRDNIGQIKWSSGKSLFVLS